MAYNTNPVTFSIDSGSHWTMIMQAFAARSDYPLEILKITAVGTCEQMIAETGKQLSSFAETINLPFSFKIIVSDLKCIKEDLFDLEVGEAIVVFLAYRLWTLLEWLEHLEALLLVIKKLRPCLMVVKELDLSSNKTTFLERFNEALYYLSAMLDCVKASMEHQKLYRKLIEEAYLGETVHNIITAEGTERCQRHERIGFWRSLFKDFGFFETDLSHLSLRQAKLLLGRSHRLSSCSLILDGKCLSVGWNGTPLESISAWKPGYSSKTDASKYSPYGLLQ